MAGERTLVRIYINANREITWELMLTDIIAEDKERVLSTLLLVQDEVKEIVKKMSNLEPMNDDDISKSRGLLDG